jgi:hypothetical protein
MNPPRQLRPRNSASGNVSICVKGSKKDNVFFGKINKPPDIAAAFKKSRLFIL